MHLPPARALQEEEDFGRGAAPRRAGARVTFVGGLLQPRDHGGVLGREVGEGWRCHAGRGDLQRLDKARARAIEEGIPIADIDPRGGWEHRQNRAL